MIRTVLLDGTGAARAGGSELIEIWQGSQSARIWIDLQEEDRAAEAELLDRLGCHELAISDAQRLRHPPKIEAFDDHTFILYRGIRKISGELGVEPQQIAFFVSERMLITRHPTTAMSVEHWLSADCASLLAESPGRLALAVMHSSVGLYLDHLLAFEGRLSDIEDVLLTSGNDELMRELIRLKSRLVKLKRSFSYHEAVTQELVERPHPHIDSNNEDLKHYINDLHERCERVHSLAQMYYAICSDLIDGYLSISSHRLNLTMKVLTVITAIFVPLSFLAGIYGMNFEHIPELSARYGYFILLGVMATIACALLITFRLRRWI